jgi:hypothetical protein
VETALRKCPISDSGILSHWIEEIGLFLGTWQGKKGEMTVLSNRDRLGYTRYTQDKHSDRI